MKSSHRSFSWPAGALLLAGALFAAAAYGNGVRHHGPGPGHWRPPRVPAAIQVPSGNKLDFRVTGVGVQIYTWTVDPANPEQGSWILKAPHALLFSHASEVVGIHFGGPTWQANDGSKVVAARVGSVTVRSDAIPWLLLEATSSAGEGALTDVTYIQRINTTDGLAPGYPGTIAGEEVLVPYVADYYFYRAQP